MRKSSLLLLLLLCGCQITIDPVLDEYYGFRATFTLSPNVLPDPPHEEPIDLPDE